MSIFNSGRSPSSPLLPHNEEAGPIPVLRDQEVVASVLHRVVAMGQEAYARRNETIRAEVRETDAVRAAVRATGARPNVRARRARPGRLGNIISITSTYFVRQS